MLFEKILQRLTGNLPMLDMVFITTKTNKILNYPEIRVVVNGSTDELITGSKIEHGPPHFHLMADGLDISISLPNYDILAIYTNKHKKIYFATATWQSSGQNSLRKSLLSWLDMNGNEQDVFLIWNKNNSNLQRAYFNFEQTKKFVVDYMSDFSDIMPSRAGMGKNIAKNSFIDKETLEQVFESLGVK